ncbi:MAG: Kelch repeat-containing protein [Candidatus Limnocylindrales bacterium]
MHLAHKAPSVLPLGDGRVMVVGNAVTDTYRGVLPDDTTRVVELWSPTTRTWTLGPSLSQPRDRFAAVVLNDGRALIIGGLNQASVSFSSAYVFDPATNAWSKTGLLGTARYGSAAAVLADGRVLVAGGRYSTGREDYDYGAAAGVQLASYGSYADVDPGPTGRALATAELFDPKTGTWSPTGSMRWARDGASAVTLGDGRVLVSGGEVNLDDEHLPTAEIYDPATGRFNAAPSLPQPSADLLASIGAPVPQTAWSSARFTPPLVALPTGGALLCGVWWASEGLSMEASLRFESSANRWVFVGEPYVERQVPDSSEIAARWGTPHPSAVTLVRSDSTAVFVDPEDGRTVNVLDTMTARWARLASVPVNMAEATGIELADGSLLLVPAKGVFTDAYRFVPGS